MPVYHTPAPLPEFGTGLRDRIFRNPYPASRAELAGVRRRNPWAPVDRDVRSARPSLGVWPRQ